jgi:hypothetical protein
MQIPIVSGIYTDNGPDFRTSYPLNLVPVPKTQGISEGYLRPADGIVQIGTGPGQNRGGINWNGILYRVMGTKLVSVASNGTVTTIGDIGGSGRVTFTYGPSYLAIASSNQLWLYDGTSLAQVTDPDLGNVVDVIWIDGYFMTTDGSFLVVTDLNNPFSVDPLKYGASEADPDPVVALLKLRNEVYALNRYTIEVFDNLGTSGFPFGRIEGAQIQKGTVGTHANCVFVESIAFLGGGFNEAPAVYLGNNGSTVKISTREIDQILQYYTEAQLAQVFVEARADKGHQHLYINLPDKTLVYDAEASQAIQQPVWFILSSSMNGEGRLRVCTMIWAYDRWNVCDTQSAAIGYLDSNISTHWGQKVAWEFTTPIVYNESKGVLFHEIELVSLTGRASFGLDPTIWTQYSTDGLTWSVPKSIKAGKTGERDKRLVWLQQGSMRNWRIQRVHGTSDAHIAIARLEARVEPLNY